jgi:hypothetical protein
LGYDFITSSTRSTNPLDILSKSLTYLPPNRKPPGHFVADAGNLAHQGTVAYLKRRGVEARPVRPRFWAGAGRVARGGWFVWLMFASQLASIASPLQQPQTNEQLIQRVVA